MVSTGVLGSSNSTLGNIILGVLFESEGDILVTTSLALSQNVATNFDDRAADNELAITQDVVVVRSHVMHVTTALALDGAINGTVPAEGSTEIELVQQIGLEWERDIAHTLSLTSEIKLEYLRTSAMELVSDVIVEQARLTSSTLALTHAVQVSVIYNRSLETEIDLSHTFAYFLPNDASECNFAPFIGGGDVEYMPPDTTAPVFNSATLTLTYPLVSPTTTLVLRNPDFGNNDRLSFQRINRVTRGGTLVVFADPNWPKQEVLSVTVSWLKRQEADALLTFIQDSLGQEIGLLDWEGKQWRGIITTPDASITHNGRHNRVISFEFEGELA
jgi:hypothetical protein